jgi:hypothetical protein
MANIKVLKSRSEFRVKVRRSKINVRVEMSCQMKYESPITYHSKDMASVKVFAYRLIYKGRQTDGQAIDYEPPIFRYGGITRHHYSKCSFFTGVMTPRP